MQRYSQRNSQWQGITLGWGKNNTTTIGSHGCTITDIGMLAGITPKEVNERLIAVKGYVQSSPGVFNLVIWSKIQEAIPWLQFEWRNYTYAGDADNNRVKAAIEKNGACLVEVDFDGTPRTDDRHWVLYIGNQKMNDPWTGTERPTSTYSIAKGFAIINVIGDPEAVDKPKYLQVETKLYENLVHNSTLADQTVDYLSLAKKADDIDFSTVKKSLEARDGKLTTCKNDLATRDSELAAALSEVSNREEQVGRVTEALTSEINHWKSLYDGQKDTQTKHEEELTKAFAVTQQLQSKLDEEAKAKGRTLIELAETKSKLENAQKDAISSMSFSDVFAILIKKWLKINT